MKRMTFCLILILTCLATGCEGLPNDQPDAQVDWDGYHPPDLFTPGDKSAGGCDGGHSDGCSNPG